MFERMTGEPTIPGVLLLTLSDILMHRSLTSFVLLLTGLQASVDTRVIRTEEQLWRSILPRLLLAAQKMWRRGPYENLLRVRFGL